MTDPAETKAKTPLPYGFILNQALKARAGDRHALSSAFVWGDPPQGHSFWASAHDAMLNGAPLPDDAAAALDAMIAEAKARGGMTAAERDLYAAGEAICAAAAEVEAMLDAGEPAPDDSAMWESVTKMRAALRRARGEG